MKLKEKLAREYVLSQDRTEMYPYPAFIAGFEKAREMAIDLAMKWNREDFERLKGSTFSHDHFPSKKILFTGELKALGESEDQNGSA